MKPAKEGWPLWIWLKGARTEDAASSKIEHLLSVGTSDIRGRVADNFTQFVYRFLRRYPNTILAADANDFYSAIFRRYRTNLRSIDGVLPMKHNSIGYLSATESDRFPVSATAWANVVIRYSDAETHLRILDAARHRESELAKKKNRMLSGEAREAAILLAELSGGLRK